jgi:hypothetical protein
MSDHDLLRARLRDADPAASLAPVDPDRVPRLLEDAMGPDTDTPTESRASGIRGRSPLTWLVAAAAVALIALAATFVLTGRGEAPTAPPSVEPPPATLELSLPGETAVGRCMVPDPEVLGRADVAFAGEVVSVADGRVVLRPTQFYTGGPADQVEVDQASASMQALVLGVRFEEGRRYLVAASEGDVMVCGFSGAHGAQRARLYEEAFAE